MRKKNQPGCRCCRDDISIPGCPCASSPRTLFMSSSNPESNNRILQSATLAYVPTPSELLPIGLGQNSYLSTSTFTDLSTGDQFWYHFSCYIGYYVLTRVYATSLYGSPFRDSTRYRWPIGLSGNTCNPFDLHVGLIFSGGDPSCVVTVSGFGHPINLGAPIGGDGYPPPNTPGFLPAGLLT